MSIPPAVGDRGSGARRPGVFRADVFANYEKSLATVDSTASDALPGDSQHMSETSDGAPRRIDLCLRAAGPEAWNHQQRIVDRLEVLDDRGEIDGYRIQTWGKVASPTGPLSDTRFHRAAVGTVREFESWADERGDVELPFSREEFDCEVTDQHHRVIRLPLVCLAVYEDGELVGVYPRTEDGTTYRVRDALQGEGDPGAADPPGEYESRATSG